MKRQAIKREGFRLLDWVVYLSVPIIGFIVGSTWGILAGAVSAVAYAIVAVMTLGYLQARVFPSAQRSER